MNSKTRITWKRSSKVKQKICLLIGFGILTVVIFVLLDQLLNNDPENKFLITTYEQWEFKKNVSRNALRKSPLLDKMIELDSDPNVPFGERHYSDIHDNYADLKSLFTAQRTDSSDSSASLSAFEYVVIREKPDNRDPTLGEAMGIKLNKSSTTLERLQFGISRKSMYKKNDPVVFKILHELATVPIKEILPKDRGTQLKLTIMYKNGIKAMFKPGRYERERQTIPEHYYFSDFERHNAEIAAFHLDRLLDFRRAFPVTGRKLNVTSEIYDLAPNYEGLTDTFFKSPPPFNKTCFYGDCNHYCDTNHALCGNPDLIEGSFVAFMPEFPEGLRSRIRHPWRRSYSTHRKADWETDEDYCDKVRAKPPYHKGRRLLDLMDLSIFDFLIGNQDRHHYEVMKMWEPESATVHVDHGRAFGRPFWDDMSILTPIDQCCVVRESTIMTLLKFHNGKKRLSQAMRESMLSDPLAPILWEPHLQALDRRVKKVLDLIRGCIMAVKAYQSENDDKKQPAKKKVKKVTK